MPKSPPQPARTPTPGTWRRSGDVWVVGLDDSRTPLRDSKGLRHLGHLLANPGQEVGALELVALAEGTARAAAAVPEDAGRLEGDAGAVLDEQAKRAYRERLREAQEEIEEAAAFNDPERAERARMEVEFLVRELSAATGLGGRDRRMGAVSERARVNVTRAIRTAIERIAEHDGRLAEHLRAAVRTGTYCVYEPPTIDPVAWDFSEAAAAAVAAAPGGQPATPRPAAGHPPAPAPSDDSGLLERSGELAALEADLAAAAAGSGRMVVVEGPPGIGKSTLLAAAVARAQAWGFAVLQARARELETPFAFGVVRQLFDPPLAERGAAARTPLLAGAVAPAAALLGFEADPDAAPGAAPGGVFPVLHGFYWLAVALAQERPLALVVDDAHWADAETLEWLAYLGPRMADVPVVVVIGTRPVAEAHPAYEELLDGRRATLLRLEPLSDAAVGTVVRGVIPEADDAFVTGCAAASGGNPFFLRELVASSVAAGIRPDADGARQLRSITPDAVARLVLARLRALPPAAADLARACSLLAPVDSTLAARIAGIAPEEALDAADALAAAGILTGRQPLDFVHPLIRSAVEGFLTLSGRTALHERAARLLLERRAPPADVAAHLLHVPPAGDPAAVTTLTSAARHSAAHGAPATAVRLLERALAEPPPADETGGVLLELARARADAGHTAAAVEALEHALPLAQDPVLHAELVDELCRQDPHDPSRVALVDGEVARIAPIDRELRFRLEARAVQLLHLAAVGRPESSARREYGARLARVAAEADGQTAIERVLRTMHAAQQAVEWSGTAAHLRARAEQALEDGVLMQLLASGDEACDAGIEVLVLTDALEAADRHAREAERGARRRGAIGAEGYLCVLRALIAVRRGALPEAESLLRSAFPLTRAASSSYAEYAAQIVRAVVAIERGDPDVAEDACASIAAAGVNPVSEPHARGLLLAARGEHDLAVAQLRRALDVQRQAGRRCSLALGAVAADLVVSLAATGATEEADRLAGEHLAAARAFGAPSWIGSALRAKALTTSGEEREAQLAQAADVLRGTQAVLEQARVLHALGSAQLAAGEAETARTSLLEALTVADRCGARRIGAAVRAELDAAGLGGGGRAAVPSEELTPGERRVAELVAEGAADIQIAQALLITLPAVAERRAAVHRKLGVRDPAGIALALAAR